MADMMRARPALADVLREVNEIRVRFGVPPLDELPSGPRSGYSCPLAQVLPGCTYAAPRFWCRAEGRVEYSPLLRSFVLCFDAKRYPELLCSSAEVPVVLDAAR